MKITDVSKRAGVAALGTAALLAGGMNAASAAPSGESHGAQRYTVDFQQLNDSGVHADGFAVLHGSKLTVHVTATGLLAGAPHLQHIHGFTDGTQAQCPTSAQDANGDGLVDVSEGGAVYGGFVYTLSTQGYSVSPSEAVNLDAAPVADAQGRESYTRTFDVDPATLGDLTSRVIVVHGADLNGNGVLDGFAEASLPVACATIAPAA